MNATAIARINAVVHEGLLKRLGELAKRAEVAVITDHRLMNEHSKQGVVKVVAPLRIHSKAAGFARSDQSRIIQIALRDQHQLFSKRCTECLDFRGQLLEEVNRGAIDEGVD